jgi:hypothetical protein
MRRGKGYGEGRLRGRARYIYLGILRGRRRLM